MTDDEAFEATQGAPSRLSPVRLASRPPTPDVKAPSPAAVATATRATTRAGLVLFLLLAVAGTAAAVIDRQELREILSDADWRWLAMTVLFVGTSYAAQGFAFRSMAWMFHPEPTHRPLFIAGLLSGTVNNLVASGGFLGYGVRMVYLGRLGIPARDVLAVSVFLGYLNHLLLTLLFPLGLVYLAVAGRLHGAEAVGLVAATCLMIAVLLGLSLFWWMPAVRGWFLGTLAHATQLILRRDPRPALEAFANSVETGRRRVLARPRAVVPAAAWVVIDWGATIAVLWLCLATLGHAVTLGVAVTAFAVGIGVTTLSMIPTGVGLQDLTLVGTLVVLGVPAQVAILANALFRATYNFLPLLIGLVALGRLGLAGRRRA